jgi:hypothetical protein
LDAIEGDREFDIATTEELAERAVKLQNLIAS